MDYLADVHSLCEEKQMEIESSENGVTHIARNVKQKNVRQYLVDGDVFEKNKSPKRCDYLVIADDERGRNAYFIELKTYTQERFQHGFIQLAESYKLLKSDLEGTICHFRLVLRTSVTKATLTGKGIRDWRKGGKHRKAGVSPMIEDI